MNFKMKIRMLLVVFVAVALFGSTAYAENAPQTVITGEKAFEIAVQYAEKGSQVVVSKLNKDGKEYEVLLINDAKKEIYELRVDAFNAKVIASHTYSYLAKEDKSKLITEQEATAKANGLMPKGSTHLSTSLKYDGSKPYYESIFTYKTMKIATIIDGLTAEVRNITACSVETLDPKAPNFYVKDHTYTPFLSKAKAELIAVEIFNAKEVKQNNLSVYQGYWEYVINLETPDYNAMVIVDPENSKVLEVKYELKKGVVSTPPAEVKPGKDKDKDKDEKILSEEEVTKILLEKVPQGEVIELSLEKDDGRWEYEAIVTDDKYEYEFEVNAKTGKILEMEKEKIDSGEDEEEDD